LEKQIERQAAANTSDFVFVTLNYLHSLQNMTDEIANLVSLVSLLQTEIMSRRSAGRVRWAIRRVVSEAELTRLTYPPSAANHNDLKFATRLWLFFSTLRSFEFKFAFKTATTITLMALPAFMGDFQDIFYEYRLNWAMTSAIVVMTPSVGGSNIQGLYRILGTLCGTLFALATWLTFPLIPAGLAFTTFLIAVPAFYLILKSSYPRIGQVHHVDELLCFNYS
jgi:hypothetical protein